MGFWRSRTSEKLLRALDAERESSYKARKMHDALREEICWRKDVEHSLREDLKAVQEALRGRERLLADIQIAVGRVKVFEGQPISSFALLPELVSMVVHDHEELETRIDAVVAYLRHLGVMEGEPETIRQDVGKLLQGAPAEIVDLQGETEIKEE